MDNRELTWRSGWFAAATMQHGRERNRREQHWIAGNRREQHKGEGGRLFMVIICPIGWGMAQRGESKHKERFVQRQRNARPNKRELALPRPLVVPLRVPLLVIFQIVHCPHSALITILVRIFQMQENGSVSPLHFLPA